MPRRGENIYHRKDGRWEERYNNGIKNGKTTYSWFRFCSLIHDETPVLVFENTNTMIE